MNTNFFWFKAIVLLVAGLILTGLFVVMPGREPVAPRPFLEGLVDGIILVGLAVWLTAAVILVWRRRSGGGDAAATRPGQLWLAVGMTGLMAGIWLARHLPAEIWCTALVIAIFVLSILANLRYLTIIRRRREHRPE
ncbi:MAG: hypothetical protein JXQ27_13890 [Acidobacteria bacterium]|nr:hypothetical protein [Acidobacteriota bacterium]